MFVDTLALKRGPMRSAIPIKRLLKMEIKMASGLSNGVQVLAPLASNGDFRRQTP